MEPSTKSNWILSVALPTLLLLLYCSPVLANSTASDIVAATWNFHEFSTHITVILFLFVMVLIKIAYHRTPYLAEYVPESLILILIGIVFGAIVRYVIEKGSFEKTVWQLTPELFFNYLLPPVVLESSYSLYNRTFSEYLGVVLLFAVIGTVLNFLIIGFAMYGLFVAGAFGGPELDYDVKGFLLFSSLIVAVDPVAVLAIFQDIGVELGLYYIVFGESLLNDAITVVLYNIMVAFTGKDHITLTEIGVGVASFFTISFGGLLIGVVIGVITCLVTRLQSHLNAFTLLLLAYFSYIIADTVGWSGIISMIGCGLVQAAYSFHNLDRNSVKLVRNLTKVVAEMCESVIFLFLGIEVVSNNLAWHTGYMLWSLGLCIVARAVVTIGMTALVNLAQVDGTTLSFTQQIILTYGGLRGAVAFSLAVLIPPEKLGHNGEYGRQVIVTATLFIILFTVGFMGVTMKPLVKLLKIRMEDKHKLSLFGSLNDSVLDETLAAIEALTGSTGRNAVRDFFRRLDETYFRKILQREPETYDQKLVRVYEKIALKLHYATMQPSKTEVILEDLPETLKYKYMNYMSTVSLPGLITSNMSELNMLSAKGEASPVNGHLKPPPPPSPQFVTSTQHVQLESGRRGTLTMEDDDTISSNVLRSARRASLLPNQKRQQDFDEAFMDVLRSRSRAINQQLGIRSGRRKGLPGTKPNLQSMLSEDDETRTDPSSTESRSVRPKQSLPKTQQPQQQQQEEEEVTFRTGPEDNDSYNEDQSESCKINGNVYIHRF